MEKLEQSKLNNLLIIKMILLNLKKLKNLCNKNKQKLLIIKKYLKI